MRDLIHTGDRLALGEAKRIFANSKNVARRLWDGLQIPADVLYHPSPAMTAMLAMTARRVRRLPVLPEPARAAEAAVARDRRDAAREERHQARAGRPGARRARAPRPDPAARARRQGPDRDRRLGRPTARAVPRGAGRLLRALRRGLRLRDDRGVRGGAARRDDDRRRWAARVRAGGRDGVRRRARSARDRGALRRARARCATAPDGWAKAGNALVREVVPTWPQIVARLLD